MGLILENATHLQQRNPDDFLASPVRSNAPYAGPLLTDENGVIQRIELKELVPDELWDQLAGTSA